MSGPDVLGWGPDKPTGPPRPRRRWSGPARRRWTGLAGTVVIGAAAAVLAVRAGADPAPPPTPQPTRTFQLPPPVQGVTEVAFGTEWAYALIAACAGPEETRQCRYRLARRPLTATGAWTPTAIRTGPVAGAGGLPRLFVDGDRVTVVDQPTVGNVYTSPDGGKTMTVQPLRAGPPVPAALKDDIVDLALCESCLNQLTLLEPRTGRLRQLAQQPPLDAATGGIRSIARSGGALWATGFAGARLTTTVSVDGGRTWRRLPVGDVSATVEFAYLLADGRGGTYLVVSRDLDPQTPNEFSELWRIGDPARPGATWEKITPAQRPRTVNWLLVSEGALVVQDEVGGLRRLGPDGVLRALPPIQVDGAPAGADSMIGGPGQLLLGPVNPPGEGEAPRVLLSRDGGRSWRAEKLPPP